MSNALENYVILLWTDTYLYLYVGIYTFTHVYIYVYFREPNQSFKEDCEYNIKELLWQQLYLT